MTAFVGGAAQVSRRFTPVAEAASPVTDWGFTRSDAVYDVVHIFRDGFFGIPQDLQARGAQLWIAETPRVPDASFDPTVKTYPWGDLTSGLVEAHDRGFDTAVLRDAAGFVPERTAAPILTTHHTDL